MTTSQAWPIRLHAVRVKRRSRYRSPAAFNITTSKLLRARASIGLSVKIDEKG